jgi:hypothetical protein
LIVEVRLLARVLRLSSSDQKSKILNRQSSIQVGNAQRTRTFCAKTLPSPNRRTPPQHPFPTPLLHSHAHPT